MPTVEPFFTNSCQRAVTRLSVSRAVTTTCTSAPWSRSIARTACSALAAAKNSLLTIAVPGQSFTSATIRSHASAASGPRRSILGSSRTTPLAHRCSRTDSPGSRTPCRRSSSSLFQSRVCRYVVPVFGRPTWKKTVLATSERLGVLLQRLADLLLVALGHREQQLLDDVGQLGQPQVELAALLHLVLEHRDALAQRLDALGLDTGAEPAEVVGGLPRAHLEAGPHACHSTTNRPIRCPTPTSGLLSSMSSRDTTVAPRASSSCATIRTGSVRRWLSRVNGSSWPRATTVSTYSRPPSRAPRSIISHARHRCARPTRLVASAMLRAVTTRRPGRRATRAPSVSTERSSQRFMLRSSRSTSSSAASSATGRLPRIA